MLQWGATRSIELQLIQPGSPTQNAHVESLNGRVRDELLNAHTFLDIQEARRRAECWRQDYDETRPHSSLGYRTPKEFARTFSIIPLSQLLVVPNAASRHRRSRAPSVGAVGSKRQHRSLESLAEVPQRSPQKA
jgi:hypothetical protein